MPRRQHLEHRLDSRMEALTILLRSVLRRPSSPTQPAPQATDEEAGDALVLRPRGPQVPKSLSLSDSETSGGSSMTGAGGAGYTSVGRGDFRGAQWVGRAKIKGQSTCPAQQ